MCLECRREWNWRWHKKEKEESQLWMSVVWDYGKIAAAAAAAAAKSLQSCPTLSDPIDSSPPGSPVPGILQARTLEWVSISFSNAWKWKVKSLSRVRLFVTPWTIAYQAPSSMGFSRQEYLSGLPFPSPSKLQTLANVNWLSRWVHPYYLNCHFASYLLPYKY